MNAFVATLAGLLATANAGVVFKTIQNEGPLAGPVHAAFGDLVQTQNGLRSISLEGFSEDVNQDGFVDPVGQAVVAPVVAPAVYHAPIATHAVYHHAPAVYHAHTVVAAPTVKKVEVVKPVDVKPVTVKIDRPLTYAAPAVTYTHTAPFTTYTHAAPFTTYAHAPAVYAAGPLTAQNVLFGTPASYLPTITKVEEPAEAVAAEGVAME